MDTFESLSDERCKLQRQAQRARNLGDKKALDEIRGKLEDLDKRAEALESSQGLRIK